VEAEIDPWQPPTGEQLERFAQGFAVLGGQRPDVLEPSAVISPARPPEVRGSAA